MIVNVSSTAGLRGGRDRAAYGAAKGALVQLTRRIGRLTPAEPDLSPSV